MSSFPIKPLLISEETGIGHPYRAGGAGLAVFVEGRGTEVVQFQSGWRHAFRTESQKWTQFEELVGERIHADIEAKS